MLSMTPGRKKILYLLGFVLLVLAALSQFPPGVNRPVAAADIQISREQFSRYIDDWSEAEGYFDTDNFISTRRRTCT